MSRFPERIAGTPCRTAAGDQPRGFKGPIAGGEDKATAMRDERGGAAGLGSGPLVEQQELPAGVVDSGPAQVDDNLQREQVAVEVAGQGIPDRRSG